MTENAWNNLGQLNWTLPRWLYCLVMVYWWPLRPPLHSGKKSSRLRPSMLCIILYTSIRSLLRRLISRDISFVVFIRCSSYSSSPTSLIILVILRCTPSMLLMSWPGASGLFRTNIGKTEGIFLNLQCDCHRVAYIFIKLINHRINFSTWLSDLTALWINGVSFTSRAYSFSIVRTGLINKSP